MATQLLTSETKLELPLNPEVGDPKGRPLLLKQGLLLACSTSTVSFVANTVLHPFAASNWRLHDLLAVTSLAVMALAFAVSALVVRTARDWSILALHAVVAGFLIRSIPVLLVPYPPLHDGYFYLVTLLNVTDAHSLHPIYGSWYSQVGRQLDWPLLQLLTAELRSWSGISVEDLWRFLPPALGALTFIAGSLVARSVYASWRIAAVAGLLGSFGDLVLYYQSEYQPQGAAILIFTFLVYMILISRSVGGVGSRVLMLLAGVAFLFTHHASSLVVPFILAPLLVIPYVARAWCTFVPSQSPARHPVALAGTTRYELAKLERFGSVVAVLIITGLTLQLYLSSDMLRIAALGLDPFVGLVRSGSDGGSGPPWLTLLRAEKYLLLVPAIIGVVAAIRHPTAGRILLVVLLVGLCGATAVGTVAFADAATRFFAFWYPFVSIFAAAALIAFASGRGHWRRMRVGGSAVLIAALLGLGIADSHVPAYLFRGLPRTSVLWYGDHIPRTDRVAEAGRWLDKNTAATSRYGVDFSTRMAPFFFARRSDLSLIYDPRNPRAFCGASYYVVDHQLDRHGFLRPRVAISYTAFPRNYDNGSISIYNHSPNVPCTYHSIKTVRVSGGTSTTK